MYYVDYLVSRVELEPVKGRKITVPRACNSICVF